MKQKHVTSFGEVEIHDAKSKWTGGLPRACASEFAIEEADPTQFVYNEQIAEEKYGKDYSLQTLKDFQKKLLKFIHANQVNPNLDALKDAFVESLFFFGNLLNKLLGGKWILFNEEPRLCFDARNSHQFFLDIIPLINFFFASNKPHLLLAYFRKLQATLDVKNSFESFIEWKENTFTQFLKEFEQSDFEVETLAASDAARYAEDGLHFSKLLGLKFSDDGLKIFQDRIYKSFNTVHPTTDADMQAFSDAVFFVASWVISNLNAQWAAVNGIAVVEITSKNGSKYYLNPYDVIGRLQANNFPDYLTDYIKHLKLVADEQLNFFHFKQSFGR